jgi:translation initiation factor IF-2
MNISTLAKVLGTSINDLREIGEENKIYGFKGRNTRIPYNSAVLITKIIRPEKADKLQNDDRIYLSSVMTVSEFAEIISKPVGPVIKTLLMNGIMATMNEKIDFDTASLIANELGVEVLAESEELQNVIVGGLDNLAFIKTVEYESTEDKVMQYRPPVVTVMGHVDHGKTTLLDTIRKTNIVATEAGAITQHISSYQIEYKTDKPEFQKSHLPKGKNGGVKITFVDTPGHEAFAAMRARGTQLADFIILMVSAVEGPKPQTIEVIERAKLSKTPVIVAINKVDLPTSDVERVKGEIAGFGLTPEEWGGETPFIPISAKTGQNLEKLLETILVSAELMELKGQIDCQGQAVIIESHLDKNLGIVGTALVVKDTLRVGDTIRCNEFVSKIKRLENTEGKKIEFAAVGDPVVFLGLPEVVNIGEPVIVYKDNKQAIVDAAVEKLKKQNKKFISHKAASTADQINIIIKADVSGSLEAIKDSIVKIPQDKVKVVIKQDGVGPITETDLEFARITGSTLISFHQKIPASIESQIEKLKINLVQSDIIYEILTWIEEEIASNTKYEVRIDILGQAKILGVFRSEKSNMQVFGGEVFEGKILSNKPLRVIRDDVEIGRMEIDELQKNKFKTSEVNISQQFGVSASGKVKIQKNDIIQSIDEIVIK